jgi:hypothetical protein
MSITEQVQKAINENLPALAAGELKNFIAEAEANKAALAASRKELDDLRAKQHKFIRFEERESDVTSREKAAYVREQKLALDEAVLKVKQECENQRVSEIRNLVQTVFQSNRLDYALNLNVPVNHPAGYTENKNLYGNITKTP